MLGLFFSLLLEADVQKLGGSIVRQAVLFATVSQLGTLNFSWDAGALGLC